MQQLQLLLFKVIEEHQQSYFPTGFRSVTLLLHPRRIIIFVANASHSQTSMDPMEALAFAKGVEEYRPLFLEDPIAPDSPETMADIAARTNIPIATGERFINIQEFETIFQKRAARYVRPDVCALGGLTPSKKVAAMAEANYCKIVPHNPLGPVSTAAWKSQKKESGA